MANIQPPEQNNGNNSNDNNDNNLNPLSRLFRIIKQPRTQIIVGITIISLGVVGYTGVKILVRKLIPAEIEKQLSKRLAREVDVGEVTSFSLNHLVIEKTSIPPTDKDTSYLEIDKINAKFNLLPVLLKRPLPVYITVNKLTGLAELDSLREFYKSAQLTEPPETLKLPSLPVTLELKLRLQEAQLTVEPNLETKPVNINAQANIDFLYDHGQQPLNYQLKANLAQGSIEVKGKTLLSTGKSDNNLQIKQLYLPEIASLVENLPLTLDKGDVNANLKLNLSLLEGLDKSQIDGGLTAVNIQGQMANPKQIKALQKPLLAKASITFKGQQLNLEEVKASLGDLEANVKGTVVLKEGFNLDVNLNPLSVSKLLGTIPLTLPVKVDGVLTANLQVKGEINDPVIRGKINSTKTLVDRVLLGDIDAKIEANLAEFILQELAVKPGAGGEITAKGLVKTNLKQTLENKEEIDLMGMPLNFNFQADLPIAKIIAPYYVLPEEITIAKLLAQGQIRGNLQKPQASLEFKIPQAAAPSGGQISGRGKLVLANHKFSLTETKLITNEGDLAINGSGNLKSKNWQANLVANQINATPFLAQFCRSSASCPQDKIDLTRAITLENTKVELTGKLDALALDTIQAKANLGLRVNGGTILVNSTLDNGQIQATAQGKQIPVQKLWPELPLETTLVASNVKIQGTVNELLALGEQRPSSLNVTADATLAVGAGIVNATTNLNAETTQVLASINQVSLEDIFPSIPVEVEGTQVNLSVSTEELLALARQPFELNNFANLDSLNANADLQLAIGTGKVNANANLKSNSVQITAITNNLSPQEILPNLPVDVRNVDAQLNASARVGDLLVLATNYLDNQTLTPIPSLKLTTDANLDLADGRVSVLANVQNNQWQANINAREVNPEILARQLSLWPDRETLNLANLNAKLNLAGKVEPLLKPNPTLPIEAKSVALNLGENSVKAKGNLTIVNLLTQPDVSTLQLNIDAKSDLATLPINLILDRFNTLVSQEINLIGKADFKGTINGKNILSNPLGAGNLAVKGDLKLANFSFNNAQFEPLLTGVVTIISDQKIAIDLRGKQDAIALAITPGNLPIPNTNITIPYLPDLIEIRQGGEAGIMVEGRREGKLFIASVNNFPLELFRIAPGIEYGVVGVIEGNVKADLALNLFDFTTTGKIVVKEPGIGNIQATEIASSFSYQDNLVQLETASLKFGDTEYNLEGGINLSSGAINGKLNLEGNVQDIFATIKLSDFETMTSILKQIQDREYLASTGEIESISLGNPGSSLGEQLNLLAQIDRQIKEIAASIEAGKVPNELEIIGKYEGEVTLGGKISKPEIQVNLEGTNWQWLPQKSFPNIVQSLGLVIEENQAIAIPKILINGQFKNGQIEVEPLQLNVGRSQIYFAGNLSLEQQSGEFKVENFSVDLVKNFLPLPVDIAGGINLEGRLEGNLVNPQIQGKINLTNVALEGQLLETNIAGEFNYTDYKLNFNTTAPEEIQIAAVVPYNPLVKTDEPVEVKLNLEKEAIALIGTLTAGQIELVGGEAKANINLQVPSLDSLVKNFSLDQIILQGNLTLAEAEIASIALSKPVHLTGKINLVDGPKAIQVEELDATYGETQINIAGVLPLLRPIKNNNNPLQVKIGQQDLNLEGLYSGKVSGDLKIVGTALTPEIGGEFYLGNGTLDLPSESGLEKTQNIGAWYQWIGNVSKETAGIFQPKLKNFNIDLEGLELVRWGLYRFIFGGNLAVNGNLLDFANLSAGGAINFQRGEIYLGGSSGIGQIPTPTNPTASQTTFFLSRANDNQLSFNPQQGILNPRVDLVVEADITDYSRQLPTTQRNEIPEPLSRSGQAETLRVTLTINGQAQQLLPTLAGDTTQLCRLPLDGPIPGKEGFAQKKLDRVAKCVDIKSIQAEGTNLGLLDSPIVELSSIPSRSQAELINLIVGGQLLELAQQLQDLSDETLFQFGVVQFILVPLAQNVGFVVNETVSTWGQPLGMKDLRVFPLVEGVYELQKKSNVTVSYDYIFNEFKVRYQLRF
jgi:hypothetical protein